MSGAFIGGAPERASGRNTASPRRTGTPVKPHAPDLRAMLARYGGS
jgi:hypothetical protein